MSPTVPQCQHIKTNGIRCGSPALRDHRYCFFHQRAHDLRRMRREKPHNRIHIPLLEDGNAIQLAIQEVAEAIAEDRIDARRAGLLLFAFQTAASNLKRVDFEPQQLREETEPALSPIMQFLYDELGLSNQEMSNKAAEALPPKRSPANAENVEVDSGREAMQSQQ